jgi:hypothetical protein
MVLLGCDTEKKILGTFVAGAAHGIDGSPVLCGKAGMCKTALLGFSDEVDPTTRIINIAGIENESEISFATLHRHLLPMLDELDYLPSNQRDVLGSAFGLTDQIAADRFLVGLAALFLLVEYEMPRGLLGILDDAQFADLGSLHVLAFSAAFMGAELR